MNDTNAVAVVGSRTVLKSGVVKETFVQKGADGKMAAFETVMGKRETGFDGKGYSFWRGLAGKPEYNEAGQMVREALKGKAKSEWVEARMKEQNEILAPMIAAEEQRMQEKGLRKHGVRMHNDGTRGRVVYALPKKAALKASTSEMVEALIAAGYKIEKPVAAKTQDAQVTSSTTTYEQQDQK